MRLNTAQMDRAAGVMLAMASGDALGAGYEFGPPLGDEVEVLMEGGGGFNWAAVATVGTAGDVLSESTACHVNMEVSSHPLCR